MQIHTSKSGFDRCVMCKQPDGSDAAQTAWFLGFDLHEIPMLVSAGLLKPLGHPAATARSSSPRKFWSSSGGTKNGSPGPVTSSVATGGNPMPANKRLAGGRDEAERLTRIFHSETGKTMANPCSAGFPACRIAGFQTCVPRLFNHAFERVCTPLFIGFFATLSKMAMKYPG
jgi:hypothetical protein